MKYDSSLKRLITSINERFDIEDEPPYIMNACEIEFCDNVATGIKRISFEFDIDKEEESED